MQVMYALPFVLLSLIAFSTFLLVPSWRKYTFIALVAPIAFGAGSIAGVVVGSMLIIIAGQHFPGGALGQSMGAFVGVSFFLCGGAAGGWLAVATVRRLEREILSSIRAKQFALRVVIGLIVFGSVSFVSMAVAQGLDSPLESDRVFFLIAAVSLLVGSLAGGAAYVVARKIQGRSSKPISAPDS
jgi:hypothetical protein